MFHLIEGQINQLLSDSIFYKEMNWLLRRCSPNSQASVPKLSRCHLRSEADIFQSRDCSALHSCCLGSKATESACESNNMSNGMRHSTPLSSKALLPFFFSLQSTLKLSQPPSQAGSYKGRDTAEVTFNMICVLGLRNGSVGSVRAQTLGFEFGSQQSLCKKPGMALSNATPAFWGLGKGSNGDRRVSGPC